MSPSIELKQLVPRHSPQLMEQTIPCSLQLQRVDSQFDLQLQRIIFNNSSGAGGRCVLFGTRIPFSNFHPQCFWLQVITYPLLYLMVYSVNAIYCSCLCWWETAYLYLFFNTGCFSDKFPKSSVCLVLRKQTNQL